MRIALVTTTYLPQINGVSILTASLKKALQMRGHTVQIITSKYPDYREQEQGITRIKSYYLAFHPESRIPNPWLPSSRKKIAPLLREGFDIIHAQVPWFLEFKAVGWARKMGCPIVHTYHTLFETYGHYSRMPVFVWSAASRKWCTIFCNRMDLVLAPSSPVKGYLQSCGVRTEIEICPSGIELSEFRCPDGKSFRSKYGIAGDRRLLLFVGRIGKEKNIPFLFEVLKRLTPVFPNILLAIIGDGPERKALERLARQTGLSENVMFLGYLDHREVISGYSAADLFVFASVTETQGIVLVEAMAAGTPVVAIGKMGVLDVLQDGRGGIQVEADVEKFSYNVLLLLRDENLYRRKREEALLKARSFSIDASTDRLLGFYRRVIAEKRRRS